MDWTPVWVLPNIDLDEPVESLFFALAPASDARVRAIKRQHPEFRKFMLRFNDSFKKRIHPVVVLRRADAPEHLNTVEVAASFRDLLVASMVPYALSRNIIYNNTRNRAIYSSFFWVHPWIVSKNYKHIIGFSPAIFEVHEAAAFRGQCSPDLPHISIRRRDFDEPLLTELLRRWTILHDQAHADWSNVALFRSLNMANLASLIPAGVDATINEYGRNIGLWVSAFEILVHPGGSDRTNQHKVYDLLKRVPWIDPKNRHRYFEIWRNKQKPVRGNLACWLYKQLYSCRNDFLHGNPVDMSKLMIPKSRRLLNSIAPILYRHGLASFLNLSWTEAPPAIDDAQAVADYLTRKSKFMSPQYDLEKALQLSRISVVEQRRQHDQVRRRRLDNQIS